MKLATYRSTVPGATGDRLGVLLPDGTMADLRLAYAGHLAANTGEGSPYRMANARIPRDMTAFLTGGAPAMEAVRAALDFAEEGGVDGIGPDGELVSLKEKHFRYRPVITRPGKFLHTGLNSKKHF